MNNDHPSSREEGSPHAGVLFRERREGRVCALLLAAGEGSRMGEGPRKPHRKLAGVPVVVRAARAIESSRRVDLVIVVAREEEIPLFADYRARYALSKWAAIVPGGETRAQSTERGVAALPASCRVVAIHDGCRPLVTAEEIDRVISDAITFGAATASTPCTDTVKVAREGFTLPGEEPERARAVLVQTPQAFRLALYREALARAARAGALGVTLTDDCALVERLGVSCRLTPTSRENIKITTPSDLILAEAILHARGE